MAVDYSQAQSDPLLATSSKTTNYTPYIKAAQQASGILSNAALNAGNTSANNYGLAQSQIRAGNVNSAAYNNPYVNLGLSATQKLQNLMADPSSIVNDPGYQFNLDQQIQQLQNKNVAGGKLLSGQNIQDVAKLTSGYATSAYQQALDNARSNAQIGQQSAIAQGNQDFAAGQSIGAYQGQIGDTLGSAQVAAANAQARGLYDAARGLVAQSTSLSTPYNFGAGTNTGVNNLGTEDSKIKMNEQSFEEYQKQLAGLTNNAAANATPSGAGAPAAAGGGSSGAAGGTSGGSSNLGGAGNGTGGAGATGSGNAGGNGVPDYLKLATLQNTNGSHNLTGGGGTTSADGGNFAGSPNWNPNLSGGYLTGLGNNSPSEGGDLSTDDGLGGLSSSIGGSVDEDAVREFINKYMNGGGESGSSIASNLTGLGNTLGTNSGLPGLGGASLTPQMSADGLSYKTGSGWAKVGFNSQGKFVGPGYTGG